MGLLVEKPGRNILIERISFTAHSLQASLCELRPDKPLIRAAEFTENPAVNKLATKFRTPYLWEE